MRQAIFVAACLAAAPLQAASFTCAGTEPFWTLTVAGPSLTFDRAGFKSSGKLSIISTLQAAGMKPDVAKLVKTKRTTLTIVRGTCSDGMSDDKFSHHAVFEKRTVLGGDDVFYGCCNLK
jgi:uncharacterized membrane protein